MSRRDQAAATRAAIVDAARALFLTHGYEGTDMRSVAIASKRTTGAAYAHFEGKAALFEAAMGRPAPSMRDFLAYVAEGKFDADKGNDGAEAKLDAMACRALEIARDLYGPSDA